MRPRSELTRIGSVASTTVPALDRQAGKRADHRRHEFVEREDRRRRKPGQDHDRLAVGHREADRLAGLQRDAVGDDAGIARAGSRRGTRGRPRPWTCRPRRSRCRSCRPRASALVERRVVVGDDAELHRLAAELLDGRADDRGVGVVDRAGAQRVRRAPRSRCRSRRSPRAAGDRRRPRATPSAASTPISREVSSCPARSTVSPRAMSVPA